MSETVSPCSLRKGMVLFTNWASLNVNAIVIVVCGVRLGRGCAISGSYMDERQKKKGALGQKRITLGCGLAGSSLYRTMQYRKNVVATLIMPVKDVLRQDYGPLFNEGGGANSHCFCVPLQPPRGSLLKVPLKSGLLTRCCTRSCGSLVPTQPRVENGRSWGGTKGKIDLIPV